MPSYGSNPAAGLLARVCLTCGEEYQPYRESQRACSRLCYTRLPDVKAKDARRRKATPEDVRERRRAGRRARYDREIGYRASLRSRYGITPAEYDRMLDAQDGRCAICGEGPSGSGAAGRLHVDHSHKDGTVRALLCNGCNRGLGYFGDSPDLLMSAVAYLLGFQNVLEMRDPRSGGTGATSQVIA